MFNEKVDFIFALFRNLINDQGFSVGVGFRVEMRRVQVKDE